MFTILLNFKFTLFNINCSLVYKENNKNNKNFLLNKYYFIYLLSNILQI